MTSMKEQESAASDIIQMVSFVIEREEFGVDILKVQEIIRLVEITRVPNAPSFVEGVINLRGRIIPVIDLRERFSFDHREADKDTRIIVVELEEKIVGFMVDAVREVIRVDRNVIEPPPDLAIGIDAAPIESPPPSMLLETPYVGAGRTSSGRRPRPHHQVIFAIVSWRSVLLDCDTVRL